MFLIAEKSKNEACFLATVVLAFTRQRKLKGQRLSEATFPKDTNPVCEGRACNTDGSLPKPFLLPSPVMECLPVSFECLPYIQFIEDLCTQVHTQLRTGW